MARRRREKDEKVECYYCGRAVPERAMRCPHCGKLYSATKKLAALLIAALVVSAGLGYIVITTQGSGQLPFLGDVFGGGNGGISKTFMVIETSLGTIRIELDRARAPVTTQHIISLVNSGWYSGASFYRAVPDFVVQGGTERSAKGSSPTTVPWEDTGLTNNMYTVAMARSGNASTKEFSGTGSSEFFINLKSNPALDGYAYPFVVFGRVTSGFEVVDRIPNLPRDGEYLQRPLEMLDVRISTE